MPISRLSKLKAHEVSLVKRGANKKPFLVLKNEQGPDAPVSSHGMFQLTDEQEAAFEQLIARRQGRVTKDGEAAQLTDRAQAALKACYRILLPFKDEITEDDLDEMVGEIGLQADSEDEAGEEAAEDEDGYGDEAANVQQSADNPTSQGDDDMPGKDDKLEKAADFKKPEDVSDDQHTAGLKAAQDAYKKTVGKSKTDKAADDAGDDEEMEKKVTKSDDGEHYLASLPAEGRAYFSLVQKRAELANEALVRKSAALEQQVQALMDEKELAGHQSTLAEFKNLTLDMPKQARLLKTLQATDKDAYDSYLAQLRANNEAMRVSKSFNGNLYGSIGQAANAASTGSVGYAAPGSADAQLEAMVAGLVNKSGENIPEHKAWEKVLATPEGISLYERAANERKG